MDESNDNSEDEHFIEEPDQEGQEELEAELTRIEKEYEQQEKTDLIADASLSSVTDGPLEESTTDKYERWRKELHDFFTQRTKNNPVRVWKLQDKMPQRGSDTEFDSLLLKLGITERRHASARWLQFKKSRGIYPAPRFEADGHQLRDDLLNLIRNNGASIIRNSIQKTKRYVSATNAEGIKIFQNRLENERVYHFF